MRILMVLERDFPPDLRVENEIKSLQKQGHQVSLLCYTFNNKHTQEEWDGCMVFKRPISRLTYKSSVGALMLPLYFWFWKKHVNEVCDEIRPEAIHIHDLPLAKIGWTTKKKYKIKFILDLHENWPAFLSVSKHTNTFLGKLLSSARQWERYELISCEKADYIIVVIEEAKERLITLGIPEAKIIVVANYPVIEDFDEIKKEEISGDQVIMLYAGGIGEHRGLQYVIMAMPEILSRHPQVILKILGEGNYQQTLVNLANSLNVSKSVIFTGQVPYKRVLKELSTADIALIPHQKSEHTDSTIPHKLFQYMYTGIPVVASNCTPIERIIKDSGAGFIYTWDRPEELAACVDKAISQQDYKADKVKKAVESTYNWGTTVQSVFKIYE